MTRLELMQQLQDCPIINEIGQVESERQDEFGDHRYRVLLRKTKDNVIEYERLRFVVVNEDTEEEKAYFTNDPPCTFQGEPIVLGAQE